MCVQQAAQPRPGTATRARRGLLSGHDLHRPPNPRGLRVRPPARLRRGLPWAGARRRAGHRRPAPPAPHSPRCRRDAVSSHGAQEKEAEASHTATVTALAPSHVTPPALTRCCLAQNWHTRAALASASLQPHARNSTAGCTTHGERDQQLSTPWDRRLQRLHSRLFSNYYLYMAIIQHTKNTIPAPRLLQSTFRCDAAQLSYPLLSNA